ncbi:unnamed protein product [Boreogadus saida]
MVIMSALSTQIPVPQAVMDAFVELHRLVSFRNPTQRIVRMEMETAAPLSRLKSRHPYNKAAQELLRSTTEDLSKDGWLAAAWKQEWERAGPTQIHHYILDPGDGATGDLLPRRQWTLLNRLRTGDLHIPHIDWEDSGLITDPNCGVHVPESDYPLRPEELAGLHAAVDPLAPSTCMGVDIYMAAVQYMQHQ